MSKTPSYEEFLAEKKVTDTKDIATVLYWTSVYCYEYNLNYRRQLMRIRKTLETYKNTNQTIPKERLLKLVSDEKTDTINRNKQRIKWRWFIRLKNKIKLFYLTLLDKNE